MFWMMIVGLPGKVFSRAIANSRPWIVEPLPFLIGDDHRDALAGKSPALARQLRETQQTAAPHELYFQRIFHFELPPLPLFCLQRGSPAPVRRYPSRLSSCQLHAACPRMPAACAPAKPAEGRARHQPGAAGVVVEEQSADHLARRIEAGDGAAIEIDHLGILGDLRPPKVKVTPVVT